jgi:hypothetical protein
MLQTVPVCTLPSVILSINFLLCIHTPVSTQTTNHFLQIEIEQVSQTVKELQPDILFSASMWTPEQAKEIREIAERERPGIKTHAIPEGLQVARGPDGVVEYLLENVPGVLDSIGQ